MIDQALYAAGSTSSKIRYVLTEAVQKYYASEQEYTYYFEYRFRHPADQPWLQKHGIDDEDPVRAQETLKALREDFPGREWRAMKKLTAGEVMDW